MNIKKWFSMDWLFSETRKELKQAIQELQKKEVVEYKEEKCYKNLYFSGNSITVVLNEGETLMAEADINVYDKVKNCKTKEDILSILYPSKEEIISKNDLAILEVNSDFEIIGTNVYLKPCKLEIPEIVKATFIEILEKKLAVSSRFNWSKATNDEDLDYLEEQYQSLKMFWYKLSTNSVEKCRESVLRFCRDNDVRISKLGNLITYRCVEVYKDSNGQNLNKDLKSILKKVKIPNDYYLLQSKLDESLKTIHKYTNKNRYPKDYTVLGKLSEISFDEEETIYTSQHSYGKYKFKIGDIYKLNEDEQPDDSLDNCSSNGLHSASCHWDYSSFGKVKIVALINPAKTVFVPSSDSGKFRCSEMKIACLNPNQRGVHIDKSLVEQADKEYNDYTIEELQNIVKSKDFSSLSVQENVPLLSLPNLKDIIFMLENKIIKI